MPTGQITVKHIAVDELPGGAPAVWQLGDGFVTVLMSRQASPDELAAAFNLLYAEMACSALKLAPVSAVA